MSDAAIESCVIREVFSFDESRYGDPKGFLTVSDIKVGVIYDTQYGDLTFLHEPVMYPNPHTIEMTPSAMVKINEGSHIVYRLIDLAWVGLVKNSDGLWRQDAYCYEHFHRIHDDLI